MSLITSCPACGTMFRVVPDQLKISEGWVRCGHCAEVFDATAHLAQPTPEPLPLAVPEPVVDDPVTQPGWLEPDLMGPAEPRPPEAPVRRTFADAPVIAQDAPAAGFGLPPSPGAPTRPFTRPPWPSATPPVPATSPPPVARPAAEPPEAASAEAEDILEPSPLDAPFVFHRSDILDSQAPASVPAPSPGASPSRPVVLLQGDDVEPDANIDQVSFVRQARRKAFWRSPFARFILALVALVLAAALLLQAAYHDRDRLALAQPQIKPALEQMCQLLECRLAPPRQIDAVVIDSSGFNRLRSDIYRLSFTLRNTAPVDVAAPSLELTLTDTQDQPVLRRVLSPADYGVQQPALGAASDWSGAVGLTVAAGGARIAGYRLLAFYP